MRGFSDEERDRIREELILTGRELFLRYGPEKTNVSDVTEPVGIAKSTFYRFFDSKAELYLVVFLREREEFLAEVRADLADVEDAETGLVRLFEDYVVWLERSPILQHVLGEWNHDATLQGVPDERLQRHKREAMAEFVPFFTEWQARGEMRDVDPDVVLGMMVGVGLLALQRSAFDDRRPGLYDAVRDAMVVALARGLTTNAEEGWEQ